MRVTVRAQQPCDNDRVPARRWDLAAGHTVGGHVQEVPVCSSSLPSADSRTPGGLAGEGDPIGAPEGKGTSEVGPLQGILPALHHLPVLSGQ